ncbi:MAG: BlaI/MecI/CopY family transcriptional regulator [Planctomycetota bacterium]|nr:BlaI/MecI/CopY family transcriptional regulator [Planctomycetota bacterium]
MLIRISQSFGRRLQGRLLGKKHLAGVLRRLANAPEGEVVLLDFGGVEQLTGSWVNAMIVPLFGWASGNQCNVFPLLCNIRKEWLDDLRLVAEWNHQCYLVAERAKGVPRRASLIGHLDPAQQRTLKAVLKFGSVTGAELERRIPDEKIQATAWNNRLRDLHEKRLLARKKEGRAQIYSPVVEEVISNG